MRKLKQVLLALVVGAIVSSCGTMTTQSVMMDIQKGMSKEEITRLLGKPDFRRFDNGGEQWEYLKVSTFDYNRTIVIDFIDGRVSNMDSFNQVIHTPPVAVCPPSEIITVEPPIRPNRPGGHRPDYRAMNPQDFENLYNKVKKKPFKDDQMELLSVGVVNNYFTCNQAARLMSIFTWDDEKMKVLNMISNRIVDRENGEQVVKKLDSLFKQDDARKILGIPDRW